MPGMRQKFCGVAQTLPKAGKGGSEHHLAPYRCGVAAPWCGAVSFGKSVDVDCIFAKRMWPPNQTTVSRRCKLCKCPIAASRVSHFVCIARHTAHNTRPSARRSAYNPRHAYKRVTRTACLSHSTQSPAL